MLGTLTDSFFMIYLFELHIYIVCMCMMLVLRLYSTYIYMICTLLYTFVLSFCLCSSGHMVYQSTLALLRCILLVG